VLSEEVLLFYKVSLIFSFASIVNRQLQLVRFLRMYGEFHDQGDAEWIVIRGSLKGHNSMPCGQPTPGQPIGRPGVGHLQGVFW
jgi:hypothetical protein